MAPANDNGKRARSARYVAAHPARRMLTGAKARAKRDGLPFDLEESDVEIPPACPVMEIPLVRGTGRLIDNSPTLDRRIPALGYVKGNVQVISWLANRLKSDGTSEQLLRVARYTQINEVFAAAAAAA